MRQNILPFLILLLITSAVQSQEDSILIEKIYQPVLSCETIAMNCQKLIGNLSFHQTSEISKILEIWESECSHNELINRLRILQEISANEFNEIKHLDYINNYLQEFIYRVESSKKANPWSIFENNKPYFDYVPLNSAFDHFTKEIAKQLLPVQEKGTTAYLLVLLFSESIDQFKEALNEKGSRQNPIFKPYKKNNCPNGTCWHHLFSIESGSWIPNKKLNNYFPVSPFLGFHLGLIWTRGWRTDFEFRLIIPPESNDYIVDIANTRHDTRSTLNITTGISIIKTFELPSSFFIDGKIGFEYSAFPTDIPNPNSEENGNYIVGTFGLNSGFNFRKRIAKNQSIGLTFNYHLTPFNFDYTLVNDFGYQIVRVGLSYQF